MKNLCVGILLLGVVTSDLWGQRLNHRHDHVLNEGGAMRFTMTTGVPYVTIAELAYGLSDRVTIGVLAGSTPHVEGYGIRTRLVVYEPHDEFRVYFCTPIIYYPITKELGGDPWWLARPNINIEWITETGFRYKVGGSLIVASSHHSIFGDPSRAKFAPGIWNAVHGGIAVPIGSGVTFQTELSLVMSGLRVAGKDWVGGPPVVLVTGISWIL